MIMNKSVVDWECTFVAAKGNALASVSRLCLAQDWVEQWIATHLADAGPLTKACETAYRECSAADQMSIDYEVKCKKSEIEKKWTRGQVIGGVCGFVLLVPWFATWHWHGFRGFLNFIAVLIVGGIAAFIASTIGGLIAKESAKESIIQVAAATKQSGTDAGVKNWCAAAAGCFRWCDTAELLAATGLHWKVDDATLVKLRNSIVEVKAALDKMPSAVRSADLSFADSWDS